MSKNTHKILAKISAIALIAALAISLIACAKTQPQSGSGSAAVEGSGSVEVAVGGLDDAVTLDLIQDARETLEIAIPESNLVKADSLSNAEQTVYMKLETEQLVGSFKIRGAAYKIANLTDEQLARGIVTASAGNHAQGVGMSADLFGCKATIYVPASTPQTKKNKITSYKNVEMIEVDGDYDDAKAVCEKDAEETGRVIIPAYDDPYVIAGQGTIGLEILEQLENVDCVLVPIGGGGLASGIAVAIKSIKPDCKVIGVEPETYACMKASVEAGHPVELERSTTVADGTAVRKPGKITFEICSKYVDDFVTVSENEIEKAMAQLYLKEGVVAEGAGALGVAAMMAGKAPKDCKNIVCIISGANVDEDVLAPIVEKYRGELE